MKKSIIIISILSLLFGACQKDVEKNSVVEKSTDGKRIFARVEKLTKSSESNGAFAWQKSDTISVFTEANEWVKFFLVEGEGSSNGVFQTKSSDFVPLDIAMTPVIFADQVQEVGHNIDLSKKEVDVCYQESYTYQEGVINSPMIATFDNGDISSLSFKHVGAVLKITYNDIPKEARYMALFSYGTFMTSEIKVKYSDNEPTAVAEVDEDYDSSSNDPSDYVITAIDQKDLKDTMTFYVPIPTGDYGKFTTYLYDENFNLIRGTYGLFDRNNMHGTAKGALKVGRKDIVALPTMRASYRQDAKYSVEFTGVTDEGLPIIKFMAPKDVKYYYHLITKTDFAGRYESDVRRVIERFYFYQPTLIEGSESYSFNVDLSADDYICIIAGYNDDGFQNPNGYYAMTEIPKSQTPSAEYSSWLGTWKTVGTDSNGNAKEYNLVISQVAANKSVAITGWGSSENASLSTWKIMADWESSDNSLKIKNTTFYTYPYEFPSNSGEYNGIVGAFGMFEYNGNFYWAWPNNCVEVVATATQTDDTHANLVGNPLFAYNNYAASSIGFFVTDSEGSLRGQFTDIKNFMKFPATMTKQ